jgi:hypothetical protein
MRYYRPPHFYRVNTYSGLNFFDVRNILSQSICVVRTGV